MKNILTRIALVLLMLAMIVTATACNNSKTEDPTEAPTNPPADSPTEAPEGPAEDPSVPVDVTFIKDDVFQFTVIVPDDAEKDLLDAVEHINIMALSLTKKSQETLTLSEKDNATTEKFIYAGFLPEDMDGVYMPKEIHFGTYIIGVMEDGSIFLSSYTSDGISSAITELTGTWRTNYNKSTKALDQTVNNPTVGISKSLFAAVPVPEGYSKEDNPITTFKSGDGITQMYIDNMNTLDAVTAFDQFNNSSLLTTYSTYEMGKLMAGTYKVGEQYVYYVTHHDGALRINGTSVRNAFLPENVNEPNFEKVCDTKGYMVSVSADENNTQNGMCFVYLLADGTFLIYDGGRGYLDAKHLYEVLFDLAEENDLDEIVISAFQITHAHGDHHGFYESFLTSFVLTKKVTLKSLWMNFSTSDMGGDGLASQERYIVNVTKDHSPETKIVQLMTGQCFYVADMMVEVIHTMADHPYGTCFKEGDSNAASTMTRLTVNGFSVLMTGDAFRTCSDMAAAIYGEGLHSDALQVPHHGVWKADNGTVNFYNAVNPDYALFPCGEKLYNEASSKQAATTHLLTRVMKGRNTEGKYVFIAGHYTGAGKERITEINFANKKITIIVDK